MFNLRSMSRTIREPYKQHVLGNPPVCFCASFCNGLFSYYYPYRFCIGTPACLALKKTTFTSLLPPTFLKCEVVNVHMESLLELFVPPLGTLCDSHSLLLFGHDFRDTTSSPLGEVALSAALRAPWNTLDLRVNKISPAPPLYN